MLSIMQGDALKIPITLKLNGNVVPPADIVALRVTIGGKFLKTFPGDITASGNDFLLPLTQEETFHLPVGLNVVVVRPKFSDGSIRGWTAKAVMEVSSSADREVF